MPKKYQEKKYNWGNAAISEYLLSVSRRKLFTVKYSLMILRLVKKMKTF